jgi:acyltransferase
VHLPIAYGWSTFAGLASRWGHSLDVPTAIATAMTVLGVSLALALPAKRLYGRWRAEAAPARPSPSAALSPEP